MIKKTKLYVTAICFFFLTVSICYGQDSIIQKDYKGFTVWLDCLSHGPVAFYYPLSHDTGNFPREGIEFATDPSVPGQCQPSSGKSYRTKLTKKKGVSYDRGHLVPANHLDNDAQAIRETFFVTNILPQESSFNQRNSWAVTEKISECYREISPLHIIGGIIWGEDQSDDYFVKTHNVKTPDWWWKLIYREDKQEYVAWLFPNSEEATADKIEQYRITLEDLVKRLEFVPPLLENVTATESTKAWTVSGSKMLKCEGIETSGG